MAENETAITVRIAADVYEEIKAAATKDFRSINSEVLYLLSEALAAEKIKQEPLGYTVTETA